MKRLAWLAFAGLSLVAAAACSHRAPVQTTQPVMVPPLIDLKQHEIIGVVEFTSTSEGKLGSLATRRFVEWARRDQGMVRMIELGSKKKALRSVGRDRWDAETFKALGAQHGLNTILIGELKVSNVKPDISVLASLSSGQVTAQVDAVLEVRMIEAASGASLWSGSGSGTRSVGQVTVFSGRNFAFDAADPDRAYGALVNDLVEQATRDFRATWERR